MAAQNGHPLPDQNRTMTTDRNHPRPLASGPRARKKKSWLWLWALLAFLVLAVVLTIVILRRMQAHSALESATKKMSVPTVLIVHPEAGSPQVHLVLPGTVQAYIVSNVYAQVTGYLKRWLVDIGASVKQGQLLAEIETPETDKELQAAQAAQMQNQASVDLAQVTADRYNNLLHTNAVSQQDVDQYNGNLAVAIANLNTAKANVGRLEKTEAFKEVYAPFDGVLTQRKVDLGDLVNAGTGTSSQQLFQISQITTLRVYVQVPELYSDEMIPGLPAKLDLASNPGVPVTGKLVRTANAIDPTSLTLLVEVDVDNPDMKLLPGGYAQVHFDITLLRPPLVLPGNTLIFRAQGTQVGVVGSDNVVHLKDIKIGRDFGTKIEVTDGIQANDNVILNPSDSISEGQKVQIDTKNQPKSS
jgi:RND family efflux transporter MFP subunit